MLSIPLRKKSPIFEARNVEVKAKVMVENPCEETFGLNLRRIDDLPWRKWIYRWELVVVFEYPSF